MLMAEPTMERDIAEIMVATWERNGMRHRNGEPVTLETIRRIARPSRLWLKKTRNAGRPRANQAVRAAKGRHWNGMY